MLTVKASVESARVATVAALSGTYAAGVITETGAGSALTVDGIALAVGDRVLVKNQAAVAENGIYAVTVAGVTGATPWQLQRTTDFDTFLEQDGAFVFVKDGTVNARKSFIQTGTAGALAFTLAQTVFYTFTPGMQVFVLNENTFGIAKATISSVSITQAAAASTPVQQYNVTYTLASRGSGIVAGEKVFLDFDAAAAAYKPVVQ